MKVKALILVLPLLIIIGFIGSLGQTFPQNNQKLAETETLDVDVDSVYFHHTASKPGLTWRQLSYIEKERIYKKSKHAWGADGKLHSGHFRRVRGRDVEVFYSYHWIIRTNGKAERLLNDDEIGYHAGNSYENEKSIAICFDGNYSKRRPNLKMLKTAARLLDYYKRDYEIKYVRAHFDARETICPGPWYDHISFKGLTGREKILSLAKINVSELSD